MEWAAAIFGLASAVSWGTGDFCGGLASRRVSVYTVTVAAQFVGGLLLLVLALALAGGNPELATLGWGAAGGMCGGVGLLALYRGLAEGRMGVVAPLTAVVAGLLPVVVGAATEGLPAPWKLVGFAVALGAVWLLAGGGGEAHLRPRDLILPLVAGAGFGLFFVAIDHVADEAILWPLVAARLVAAVVMTAAILAWRADALVLPAARHWPLVLLAGLCDTGGNTCFALAARAGRLDVAAVLASLYPAATVLLAHFVLGERLSPLQRAGVIAALLALVLIAL